MRTRWVFVALIVLIMLTSCNNSENVDKQSAIAHVRLSNNFAVVYVDAITAVFLIEGSDVKFYPVSKRSLLNNKVIDCHDNIRVLEILGEACDFYDIASTTFGPGQMGEGSVSEDGQYTIVQIKGSFSFSYRH